VQLQFEEGITTAYDFLYVEIRSTSGTLLQTGPIATGDKRAWKLLTKIIQAWPAYRVSLSDCNSVVRPIFRYQRPFRMMMSL